MPIHTSWKSMARGMKSTYCKKGDKLKSRPFTDGSKLAMCQKAWSVFYATIRKKGWKEGKARPRSVNETVFNETVQEVLDEMVLWAMKTAEGGELNDE